MTVSWYGIRKYHWLFLSLYHYLKAETVTEPTMNFSLDEYEHLRREYPRLLAQIVCGEYFLLSLCESGETPVTRLFSCCIHRKHFLPGGWWKMGEVYERKLLQIKGFTKFRKDSADFVHWYANAGSCYQAGNNQCSAKSRHRNVGRSYGGSLRYGKEIGIYRFGFYN